MESSNTIFGNNPGGKDCQAFSNQCRAEGLSTQAGFSAPIVMIDRQTAIIYNLVDSDFTNGCQVTLYNLTGSPTDSPRLIKAIINNTSNDGADTYLTFTTPLTDHIYGFIALNSDFQSHSEGAYTLASGQNSYAGGLGAVADLPSKFARGDSYFANPGDGQYAFTAVSGATDSDTPVNLLINNKYLKIRNNMSYCFIMLIAGRRIDGTASAMFLRYGIIVNNAGTVSLDGDIATLGSDINSPEWSVAITADTINNALQVQVTGDSDNTVHWKARVDTLEIG